MKDFWNAFIHSLRLPKKQSVFTLNRIGMDITVIYLFFLLAIASLPALYEQIIVNETSTTHIHPFFFLIYFFIFYYLVLVLIVFSLLSIIAYIGTLITRSLKRKLRFSIIWKMTAFAITTPLLLFTVISFFYPLSSLFLFLATIYTFFILIKIILIYPKRKTRQP